MKAVRALCKPAKVLSALVVLLMLVLFACGGCGEPSGDIKVPINLNAASSIGSLHVELFFDPAVLQAIGVKAGDIAKNSMIEHNLLTPGCAIIGIVDSLGINGNGILVEVSFDIVDEQGNCQLTLENIEAYNVTHLMDIICETASGSYTAEDKQVMAPVITMKP